MNKSARTIIKETLIFCASENLEDKYNVMGKINSSKLSTKKLQAVMDLRNSEYYQRAIECVITKEYDVLNRIFKIA